MACWRKRYALLKPRGFCAGVVRAIDVVRCARSLWSAGLRAEGDCPQQACCRMSCATERYFRRGIVGGSRGGAGRFSALTGFAGGAARPKSATGVIDATCPAGHESASGGGEVHAKEGDLIVLISHKNHDEVIGTLGKAPTKMILVESGIWMRSSWRTRRELAYLTPTTLSWMKPRTFNGTSGRKRFPM